MMKVEWQNEQSIVIFYPAAESLVAYYAQEGALLDDGADRRMKFDFRRSTPRQNSSADEVGHIDHFLNQPDH